MAVFRDHLTFLRAKNHSWHFGRLAENYPRAPKELTIFGGGKDHLIGIWLLPQA